MSIFCVEMDPLAPRSLHLLTAYIVSPVPPSQPYLTSAIYSRRSSEQIATHNTNRAWLSRDLFICMTDSLQALFCPHESRSCLFLSQHSARFFPWLPQPCARSLKSLFGKRRGSLSTGRRSLIHHLSPLTVYSGLLTTVSAAAVTMCRFNHDTANRRS